MVTSKPTKLKHENSHFLNCTRFSEEVLKLVTYKWGGKHEWCSSLHNKTLINYNFSCFMWRFTERTAVLLHKNMALTPQEMWQSPLFWLWLYIQAKMHKCVSRYINNVIKNINDTPLHYSIKIMTMLERCSSTCM